MRTSSNHITPPAALQLLPAVAGVSGHRLTGLPLPEQALRREILRGGPCPPHLPGYEDWSFRCGPLAGGDAALVGFFRAAAAPPVGVLGVAISQLAMYPLQQAMERVHLTHYGQEIGRQGHRIGEQWLVVPKLPLELPWLVLAVAPALAHSAEQTQELVEIAWIMGLSLLAETDLFARRRN